MNEILPNVKKVRACKLSCVVTDAGDSIFIVDDVNILVPIKYYQKIYLKFLILLMK